MHPERPASMTQLGRRLSFNRPTPPINAASGDQWPSTQEDVPVAGSCWLGVPAAGATPPAGDTEVRSRETPETGATTRTQRESRIHPRLLWAAPWSDRELGPLTQRSQTASPPLGGGGTTTTPGTPGGGGGGTTGGAFVSVVAGPATQPDWTRLFSLLIQCAPNSQSSKPWPVHTCPRSAKETCTFVEATGAVSQWKVFPASWVLRVCGSANHEHMAAGGRRSAGRRESPEQESCRREPAHY